VTPICPGMTTRCTTPSSAINGVEEYYWFRDYNICNQPNCIFTISWGSCCRNGGITSGADNEGMFIGSTTLNTNITPCNSSPQFTTPPVPYICQGQPYIFNQGAVDPEGDSLAYSLGPCYDSQNIQVTYNFGYTPTQPLGSSWNVSINAVTGDITVLPQPGNMVVGVMCVYVEEWRNGNLINTIVRDIQMTVIACPGNSLPTSTGVTNISGGVINSPFNITVCAGTPLSFDLPTNDPNLGQIMTVFWNQNIAGATFTGPGGQSDTLTGANPLATFSWIPPSTGTYTFLMTLQDDACPILGQNQYTIVINVQGGLPNAAITATPTGCTNVQLNVNPGTGNTGPYTYVWTGDGNINMNPNNTSQGFNHTYPAPGPYFVQVEVEDNFGCRSILSDTVLIANGPTADAGPDISLCSGYSVALGSNNLPPAQTYTWTPGLSLSSTTVPSPILTHTNSGSQPVSLPYVVTATSGFCTAVDYVTVVVYPTPTASIAGTTNICLGQSTSLTASGGSSYLWSTGATTSTITVAPTQTTTYTVSAINAGCTSPPAQVTVVVSQGPVAFITGPDSVCSGDNAVLTAAGGTNWVWNNGSTNQSITLNNLTNPTTVTVTASQNGCVGAPATFTVHQYALPVANFSSNVVCVGGSTAFTDGSSISTGGPAGIIGWAWDFDDPLTGPANISNSQNPNHAFSSPGTYDVTLTVTGYNGCRDVVVNQVVVNPLPQPDFNFVNICDKEYMTFQDLTPGNITSWNWTFGSVGTSTVRNPQFLFPGPGSYDVTLSVTNSNGCVNQRTKTVFVHPLPVPVFTYEHSCFNTITQFSSQSYIVDPFGTTLDAHSWDFGDPASGANNTSSDVNPVHNFSYAGTFWVTLTVTSSQGCTDYLSIPVVVEAIPAIPIIEDTVCRGFGAVLYAANPLQGSTTLEWFYTAIGQEPFQTGNYFNTPPLDFTTQYFVAMRDDAGCLSPKTGIVAYVVNEPWVDISATVQELELPNAILEIVVDTVYSAPIFSYLWDFGDGSTSTLANPVHQYTETGTYDVSLLITNWFGCTFTQNWPNYVEVTKNIRIFIPTAFTPNGEGTDENETFHITTTLITQLHIDIFDRWGKVIFASDDLNFQWDGKLGGDPLPEGVYTYLIRATEWEGAKVTRSGTITLLR
jgi:gliding motility-associated-like protein